MPGNYPGSVGRESCGGPDADSQRAHMACVPLWQCISASTLQAASKNPGRTPMNNNALPVRPGDNTPWIMVDCGHQSCRVWLAISPYCRGGNIVTGRRANRAGFILIQVSLRVDRLSYCSGIVVHFEIELRKTQNKAIF